MYPESCSSSHAKISDIHWKTDTTHWINLNFKQKPSLSWTRSIFNSETEYRLLLSWLHKGQSVSLMVINVAYMGLFKRVLTEFREFQNVSQYSVTPECERTSVCVCVCVCVRRETERWQGGTHSRRLAINPFLLWQL